MAPEVRLTGPDNEPLGIVSIAEALRLAGEADVDLVEISPTAVPPVCRLMDYGKFKYAEQKKAAEAKSKQKVIEIKEVKFRPGTDDGDYNIKLRNIKRFLEEGDKCKITLRFRGREITHQELGLAMLARIREELADSALRVAEADRPGDEAELDVVAGVGGVDDRPVRAEVQHDVARVLDDVAGHGVGLVDGPRGADLRTALVGDLDTCPGPRP